MCVSKKVSELGQELQLSLSPAQGHRGCTENRAAPGVRGNEHPSLSVSSASAKQRGGKETANVWIVPTLQF